MRLSRPDKLRCAAEQAGQWVRDYGLALALCGGLGVAGAAVFGLDSWHGAAGARGQVVRFGSSADRFGDQRLVIVRTSDGSLLQLPLPSHLASTCRVGDSIALTRGPLGPRVGARGCLAEIPQRL
jgi:hypothetical protein